MLQLQIKSDLPDIENIQNLIKTAIESEIKNLQRSLSKTHQILLKFEEKYQVSSDFFIDHWTAEDLEGGDDEYVSWAGEIQIKHKLINALQKLEAIEYVS
jgi:hypothetical protein